MARRRKEETVEVTVSDGAPIDVGKLVRSFIKTFNKDGEDKVAWNLAYDEDNPTDVKEFISTGSTLLDYCISNRRDGGVPAGKLTEISGEEASGKSLICAHLVANVQKKGGIAVYIDTENAANPSFMEQVGVDLKNLVYLQPGTIENVFEHISKCISMARAKDVKCPVLIIWDSVAATPPAAELEGNFDPTNSIGLMARTISKGLRMLTDSVGKDRVTLVFTNQLRTKIGVSYGDPLTTPGGKAIPFCASVRIRLSQSTKLKDTGDGTEVDGIKTLAKCIKTRLGPPHRRCYFDIRFDKGIDDIGSWFTVLHESKKIEKRGGWCVMANVPGHEGELKFRESGWHNVLAADQSLSDHVRDLIEGEMVVRYGTTPKDAAIDPESLMDVESVVEEETAA